MKKNPLSVLKLFLVDSKQHIRYNNISLQI